MSGLRPAAPFLQCYALQSKTFRKTAALFAKKIHLSGVYASEEMKMTGLFDSTQEGMNENKIPNAKPIMLPIQQFINTAFISTLAFWASFPKYNLVMIQLNPQQSPKQMMDRRIRHRVRCGMTCIKIARRNSKSAILLMIIEDMLQKMIDAIDTRFSKAFSGV